MTTTEIRSRRQPDNRRGPRKESQGIIQDNFQFVTLYLLEQIQSKKDEGQ